MLLFVFIASHEFELVEMGLHYVGRSFLSLSMAVETMEVEQLCRRSI